MLLSMTGYGKATGMFNEKKIRVEIKSLNSKNLDLQLKMSSLYREKELELRSSLLGKLVRGKVDLSIYVEEGPKAESRMELNKAALSNYYEQISALSKELGDVESPILPNLLGLSDAFKPKVNELQPEEWEAVLKTVDEAIAHLQTFRQQEGAALEKDFIERLNSIEANASKVKERLPIRKEKVVQKLKDAIESLSVENSDANRFEQELIYYLEKLDISEEEVRLANHLSYFKETMQEGDTNGRKLGFIAQEIGREVNTMGSKAKDADIQQLVVLMKDDLEKIKEQVLNVL